MVCNLTWSRCDLYQGDTAFKTLPECQEYVRQEVRRAEAELALQAPLDEKNFPRIVTFGFCHFRLGPNQKAKA